MPHFVPFGASAVDFVSDVKWLRWPQPGWIPAANQLATSGAIQRNPDRGTSETSSETDTVDDWLRTNGEQRTVLEPRQLVQEFHDWMRTERFTMSKHNSIAKAIAYMFRAGRWYEPGLGVMLAAMGERPSESLPTAFQRGLPPRSGPP
jgi:hypothetical protein